MVLNLKTLKKQKVTQGDIMTDSKNSKLLVNKAEASERISKQIDKGKELLQTQPSSEPEFDELMGDTRKWTDYNKTLFDTLFDESPLSDLHGSTFFGITGRNLNEKIISHRKSIEGWINELESVYDRLELYEELPNNTQHTMNNENKKIFIGHGRSDIWRELKDFIVDTLGLEYDEFNRISPAGKATSDRLKEMLKESSIAFLIMTGEDEQADGSLHARENVIHEAGLFQGKVGFERAIILLEKGCQEFSNIHGLGQIRFPKGNIRAIFEDIRDVLKRESIM